jgi:acyl-CoA thioester hydrolase
MAEPFRHRLRVRWSECDLQGVVFYPHYLAYLDHTVTEALAGGDRAYTEMIPAHGVDMVKIERLPEGTLLTEGELRHVFVDPEDFGKREMPDRVRSALQRFAPG